MLPCGLGRLASFAMPATAGRVRMPANNRVHSSAALQTHGIWQSAIGYDPYAPDQKQSSDRAGPSVSGGASAEQNAYDSFQGLLALARLTGSNADEARGSCKRCGRVGHLTFQCRNFLAVKEEAVAAAAALMERDGDLRKEKTSDGTGSTVSSEEESSEDESELSDSSEDPDMERAIVAKFGKNFLRKSKRKAHRKEKEEAPKRKRSSKSHSKRSKSGKDSQGLSSDESSERDETRTKKHSKVKSKSKGRHRDSSESDSEDYESGHRRRKRSKAESESESDRKERRKRRKRSHRKSKRSSKHKDVDSDDVERHSSKKKHRERY